MTINHIKELDNNTNIEYQIYKLILAYIYKNNYMLSKLESCGVSIEDVANTAYIFCLDKYRQLYKPEKSKLSTFIYMLMKKYDSVFIAQAVYNVSLTTARYLSGVQGEAVKHRIDKYRQIYNAIPIDSCSSTLDVSTENDDAQGYNIGLAEEFSNIDKAEQNYNDSLILEAYNSTLESYFSKRHPLDQVNNDRDRDIITNLIFNRDSYTLQDFGDKYGLTRERVRQILASFCKYAKTNTNLRKVLGK